MKKIILFVLMFSSFISSASENKTKLVVGVVISHFYPDWLEWYKQDLSEGGFKRIVRQGIELSMNYNYVYTQTGVDHATIYTGILPAEHGIVSKVWYDRLRRGRQSAVMSGDYYETGTQQGDSIKSLSPDFIQTISLGSALKMNNGFSKVYSVAMNGEEAVLSGGSSADQVFWFSEKTGKWVSSTYYKEQLPEWLIHYNDRIESDSLANRGWMPLSDERSSAAKIRSKFGLANLFYYDIARAKREYKTYRVLKATPHANTLVCALAKRLIANEGLGRDNDPDLLAVNFSCLDYMHRDFTVDSEEEKDAFLRLDRNMEDLLTYLDLKVGKGNYTLFVTFSEMRELMPEDLRKVKLNSNYFSIYKAVALLKSYLGLIYGPGDWVVDYDQGQIYLNRDLIERKKMSLKEMEDRIADFLIDFEGIAKVITAYSLTHTAFTSGVDQLMQNAFSHKRSGDVLFCLYPTWISELKEMEDIYFRHSKRPLVPLYLYGAGVKPGLKGNFDMVDLFPTLCDMMGIPVPYTVRGKKIE
ncbi:alkaline phosphatase family protein [uncultured Sanguibacteroides sp.]|uniref:alkaline phosphatase family protein n=1 Tax=uncultured Sanguibacteroides sp. TaxID=1635151 RepID=UPI0025EEE5BD|nr:alkaline phosphatase family protein [uncultured Sanguibacteroides sp.]